MTLMTLDPRTPMGPLVEPFALMRNFMRWDPTRDAAPEGRGTLPAFDVFETAEGYRFLADLPGMRKEDLELDLTGNRLTISGRRTLAAPGEKDTTFIQERAQGAFCRTFNLPEDIEGSGVQADLKDGVLTVLVPKRPEVQPRKIEIRLG